MENVKPSVFTDKMIVYVKNAPKNLINKATRTNISYFGKLAENKVDLKNEFSCISN